MLTDRFGSKLNLKKLESIKQPDTEIQNQQKNDETCKNSEHSIEEIKTLFKNNFKF